MTTRDLAQLVQRRPEVSLGVLVFAGFAIGAGFLTLPSIPIPSLPSAAPAPAPTPAAPIAPAPASGAGMPAAPVAPSGAWPEGY